MKLQIKTALVMTILGTVIVTLFSIGYDNYSHRIISDNELKGIEEITDEIAWHLNSHLKEKVAVAITLSSAPLIKDALLKSNSNFSMQSGAERKQEIERLNEQWMNIEDSSHPFIQAHMTNPIAKYLKHQQEIMPGEYGEIFLTNRYGVMIATTGKLTTLAHDHKYWWEACYDDGQGRVFLDDRGYDSSVQGYVLGVVIPIMDGDEIIGIMKSNVNIIGSLTDVVNEFSQRHAGRLKITRTGGLIVAELDVPSLSTSVNEILVEKLGGRKKGSAVIEIDNEKQLVAFSPVQITLGSARFGFGGKSESIGHIKGNEGEAWNIIICLSEAETEAVAHKTTLLLIFVGITFTILTAIAALILGKWIANPLTKLALVAQKIGEGHLDVKINVRSNDEISDLAKSLDRMKNNLQDTMISRDELLVEIKARKKVEEKLQILSTTDELTGAYNRRAFNDYLNMNINRAKRYNEPLSVIILDIDHFKNVNDTHGHDVGDLVLGEIVLVFKDAIRQEDILARWGGEEFSCLLPQTGIDAALQLAERLRVQIAKHDFSTAGRITVSIGLTELQGGDTPDSFVKRADTALYQAKEEGRNIVRSG